jgi:hypothetical protein
MGWRRETGIGSRSAIGSVTIPEQRAGWFRTDTQATASGLAHAPDAAPREPRLRHHLPRVFHWTQTRQRRRLRVQPSKDANSCWRHRLHVCYRIDCEEERMAEAADFIGRPRRLAPSWQAAERDLA